MKPALISLALLALLLPALIILFSFEHVLYDPLFYKEEFSKYNAYAALPEADMYAAGLMEYYKTGAPYDIPFSDGERRHVRDVKEILDKIHRTAQIAGLLFLALCVYVIIRYKGFGPYTRKAVTAVARLAALFFGLDILIAATALAFFKTSFQSLHQALFLPGSWVFPENSLLIRMFPQVFFMDFAKEVVLRSLLAAFTLGILALLMRFLKKA